MEKLEKLLIVENNPSYIEAAREYFGKLGIAFDIIADYETAKNAIKDFGRALIDIFIPETKTERLGKEGVALIEEIRTMLESERDKELIKVIKESDKELYASIKRYLTVKGVDENSIGLSLKKLPEQNYRILAETAEAYGGKLNRLHQELEILAKEESLNHSPLGIRVAEEAMKLKIPFAFVTDTAFHHGHTGVCLVVEDFFSLKHNLSVKIFDSAYGRKDEQRFWETAYEWIKEK
jgi:CheY-like chemotaxis protein